MLGSVRVSRPEAIMNRLGDCYSMTHLLQPLEDSGTPLLRVLCGFRGTYRLPDEAKMILNAQPGRSAH
jgi:hypothetical protein